MTIFTVLVLLLSSSFNIHFPPQALYENMLVELPFASFFLSKLLGTSADVDIHHLASLDPEMYRNLLFLKSYEGDVEELGLNFTVVNNDLGEAQVTEGFAGTGWDWLIDSHLLFSISPYWSVPVVQPVFTSSCLARLCGVNNSFPSRCATFQPRGR